MQVPLLLLTGITFLCSIGSVVCWIMVLKKIFQYNTGLGTLGLICALFAFIDGWMKVPQYDNRKVMIWWTIFLSGWLISQTIIVMASGGS